MLFNTNLAPVKSLPSSPFLITCTAPFKPVQDTVTLSLFMAWGDTLTRDISCLPSTGVAYAKEAGKSTVALASILISPVSASIGIYTLKLSLEL